MIFFFHDSVRVLGFREEDHGVQCHFYHIISKVHDFSLTDIELDHLADIVLCGFYTVNYLFFLPICSSDFQQPNTESWTCRSWGPPEGIRAFNHQSPEVG